MTITEFSEQKTTQPCKDCGMVGVETQLNPNNNGLLVHCPHCGSKRPWGSLLYLKQNENRRPARPPLPDGETLDSIWERFGNRCIICGGPKEALISLGIGRQVHHVVPYAQEGHRGPLVPICTHCHPVVTDRQRIYWFYQRVVLKTMDADRSAINDESDYPIPSSRAVKT
jgi:hypothetical protein